MCDKPWPIIKKHVSGVITVTEEEVITAMRTVSDVHTLWVVHKCAL